MHGTLRVKRWQSNFLANKTMRYVLELYVKNNSIQNNPCPKPNYKIVYWTLPPFRKSIHNITLVNYCHLCIDYESNKHRLKIFKKKKNTKNEVLVTPVAIESVYILLHPKFKVNFCTPWNKNRLNMYMPNCTLPFFQFHNNDSITISMSENWITLTTCFRNGKILYTSFECWWLTF